VWYTGVLKIDGKGFEGGVVEGVGGGVLIADALTVGNWWQLAD
jgi:hypothetical protein